MALLADGRVVTWGGNGSGQLGNNSTTDRTYPGYVWGVGGSGYLTGVTAVASGGYHSLAVLSDGRVVSWGSNDRGELGNGASGSSAYRLVPGYVLGVGGTGQLVAVWVAGKGQSCAAVVPDGGLTAWGSNSSGMLGDGTTVDRLYPVGEFALRSPGVARPPGAPPPPLACSRDEERKETRRSEGEFLWGAGKPL